MSYSINNMRDFILTYFALLSLPTIVALFRLVLIDAGHIFCHEN